MMTSEEKVWICIAALSLVLFLFGQCRAGEIEARYAFPYSYYEQKSYHPSIPWREQYKTEMYRNRTFWQGFRDPVPQSWTDHPVCDWNYRIIRQYERERLRRERYGGTKLYRNYFRKSR